MVPRRVAHVRTARRIVLQTSDGSDDLARARASHWNAEHKIVRETIGEESADPGTEGANGNDVQRQAAGRAEIVEWVGGRRTTTLQDAEGPAAQRKLECR